MSRDQWAAIQHGDESYAGSPSHFVFKDAVQGLFPYTHVIPTHQGRAAERILFQVPGGAGRVIPSNTHFDTTRANVEYTGAEAVDLVIAEGRDRTATTRSRGTWTRRARGTAHRTRRHGPLRDDDDHEQLRRRPAGLDGQPARPRSPTGTASRSSSTPAGSPRTPGSSSSASRPTRRSPDIVREMSGLADGMTMSAKKDPMGNIGGWLALNDDDLAMACRNLLILTEGFPTYGGLAGRDLEALAQGLKEVVSHDYLRYRIRSTAYLADALVRMGCRASPRGRTHVVYVDARALLPHIPPLEYPGRHLP